MTVRDILKDKAPIEVIQVRTNCPYTESEDTLVGYCLWNGIELISLDGDHYSLDDEIYACDLDSNRPTYWIISEWNRELLI